MIRLLIASIDMSRDIVRTTCRDRCRRVGAIVTSRLNHNHREMLRDVQSNALHHRRRSHDDRLFVGTRRRVWSPVMERRKHLPSVITLRPTGPTCNAMDCRSNELSSEVITMNVCISY